MASKKSSVIYNLVDSIKKSMSPTTKLSNSPLLLTEDAKLSSSPSMTDSKPIVGSESLSVNNSAKSPSIFDSLTGSTGSASGSASGTSAAGPSAAGTSASAAGTSAAGTSAAGTSASAAGTSASAAGTSPGMGLSGFTLGDNTRIGIKVLLIVLLLGFVGINIFIYLGYSVKHLNKLIDNFINTIKSSLTGKQSKPAKESPKKESPKKESPKKESPKKESPKKESPKTMDDLVGDIEEPSPPPPVKKPQVKPDEDRSSIHSSGKSGYCNVGSWKGIRSCVKVSNANECISGDIFPTKDICINPNLRS
jgi:penicillin-insensitive murein endopeptidase